MTDLRLLTIAVLAVAALLRSEFFFYLLYVLVGIQGLAWLWVRQTRRALHWERHAPTAAFPNQPFEVRVVVYNRSRLPIPWLTLHESVPEALRTPPAVRQVVALGPGERREIAYTAQGRRRGLYQLGPLSMRFGDVLGMREQQLASVQSDSLVIYPQVLPLPELGLPAGLPFGAQAAPRSLFSDPARPIGVRAYQPGDSPRQVDWKNSARVGALQVRRHEPAIARETLLALAFSLPEYPGRYTFDTMERAVLVSASIAADLAERRQPVGLCTNGLDQLSGAPATLIRPAGGRGHLIELLRMLGRLGAAPAGDIGAVLRRAAADLSWGSTLVLVAAVPTPALVAQLVAMRRRGLHIALVLLDGDAAAIARARRHGITVYLVSRAGVPEPAG